MPTSKSSETSPPKHKVKYIPQSLIPKIDLETFIKNQPATEYLMKVNEIIQNYNTPEPNENDKNNSNDPSQINTNINQNNNQPTNLDPNFNEDSLKVTLNINKTSPSDINFNKNTQKSNEAQGIDRKDKYKITNDYAISLLKFNLRRKLQDMGIHVNFPKYNLNYYRYNDIFRYSIVKNNPIMEKEADKMGLKGMEYEFSFMAYHDLLLKYKNLSRKYQDHVFKIIEEINDEYKKVLELLDGYKKIEKEEIKLKNENNTNTNINIKNEENSNTNTNNNERNIIDESKSNNVVDEDKLNINVDEEKNNFNKEKDNYIDENIYRDYIDYNNKNENKNNEEIINKENEDRCKILEKYCKLLKFQSNQYLCVYKFYKNIESNIDKSWNYLNKAIILIEDNEN